MCGISGVFLNIKNKNSKGLEQVVERMNQSQFRRGPDDKGVFVDVKTGVALGHNRLSIIDLSKAGHQPMNLRTSDVRRLVITFNGEIYNFLDLKKDLEKKGHKFKT
ncbi:MAG: asparagine synthetase B, partial [Patescibacteria group bacterium]